MGNVKQSNHSDTDQVVDSMLLQKCPLQKCLHILINQAQYIYTSTVCSNHMLCSCLENRVIALIMKACTFCNRP